MVTNMAKYLFRLMAAIVFAVLMMEGMSGCSSKQSFGLAGRPGDPVMLNLGWHPDLKRQNLTVTIQPCLGDLLANVPEINTSAVCKTVSGPPIVYTSANDELRAVVNMAPDPLSKLVYNRETQLPTDPVTLGETIELFATTDDKEYLETSVMMDIPATIPVNSNVASVTFTDSAGAAINPQFIEIIHSTALPLGFLNWDNAFIDTNQFRFFERKDYKTITFSGATVPYAIQVGMAHNPGKIYVVNPRGDIKNLVWSDDGANLKVIITPAWLKGVAPAPGDTLSEFTHYKFHVAGDVVSSLMIQPTTVEGYDMDGNSVAVSANIN